MARRSSLDKFFGGKPGDAERARDGMKRIYGAKDGEHVFRARIAKAKRKPKPKGLFGR